MSPIPVPPPVGSIVPSEDWSNDDSFDFDSPSSGGVDKRLSLQLASSPSSSSSSRSSRRSLSNNPNHPHTGSPLRTSHIVSIGSNSRASPIQSNDAVVDNLDHLDFTLDKSDPNNLTLKAKSNRHSHSKNSEMPPSSHGVHTSHHLRTTSIASTPFLGSGSLKAISAEIIGVGPAGVGTITRLGSNSLSSSSFTSKTSAVLILPAGTVRAKTKAIERAWEADLDFGGTDEGQDVLINTLDIKQRRLNLSPPKKTVMPDPSALDDLGFDLGEMEDEDREATLKAGATIKAMLPPPRPRPSTSSTLSTPPPSKSKKQPKTEPVDIDLDLDLERDFALPLNLTNLTLVSQQRSEPYPSDMGHRNPRKSTGTDLWTSPPTSSAERKSAGDGFRWDDSPVGNGTRLSETSATSLSEGPEPTSDKGKKVTLDMEVENRGDNEDFNEEEDMESGLVLPTESFFSPHRATALNRILDKKRNQHYSTAGPARSSPDHAPGHGHGGNGRHVADESFEDGLILDNPRAELSQHRLNKSRKARTVPVPFTLGRRHDRERKAGSGEKPFSFGVHGAVSSLGLTGLRSHSSGTVNLRSETPVIMSQDREVTNSSRVRHTSASSGSAPTVATSMPPPLFLPRTTSHHDNPSVPQTPSSSRLRHQKSHFNLNPQAPLQSPSLARKQSLASLQDAMASGHVHLSNENQFTPLPSHTDTNVGHASAPSTQRHGYPQSTASRLTMPTSSSRAKIRPPVHSVFPRPPDITPSSSGSSISTNMVATPRSKHTPRVMEVPRRMKTWGDGTELEGIEDLRVDDERSSIGLGKPSRRSDTVKPRQDDNRRKKSESSKRNKQRKPAMLIKHLGAVDKKKVVGEMTWNPQALRWEGNEAVLRDFDTVASSTRPALIAHYTGSSVGGVTSPSNGSQQGSTIRIVGDMRFDPERMCWVSLNVEDEEPDPFEGMADDEDDDAWAGAGSRGGTITRASGKKLVAVGLTSPSATSSSTSQWSGRMASDSGFSGYSSVTSGGWEDRLPSAQSLTALVGGGADELWEECREAEERHRREMKGWVMRPSQGAEVKDRERREEKRLWEIRNLALRS